jgi:hypothetical protein
VGSARYGARIVTAGYTLLLVFTTGVAAGGEDSFGSVRGTVINGVTGDRLRKAYVRLAPVGDDAHTRPAVTDAEGRFVFEKIPAGNYLLEAEHPGLMESKYGEDAGAPVELRIVAGQNLSDLTIKLMPPAVISGRVRDEDGDLWPHAHINIFRSVWVGGKRQLQGFDNADVNDAGEFRAGHLPAGRYYLSAEPDALWEQRNRVASASQLQTTWYPSSPDLSSATPLVVGSGQELTGTEIRMRRSSVYRVSGKVSGLQGVPPLPGPSQFMTPRLAVSSTPEMGGSNKRGSLKPDGSFEVEGLTPGTWQIRIEQGMLSSQMALGVTTVQVDDHDVESVSLTVQAPHRLRGAVRIDGTDEPPPAGLSLWLESPDVLFWDRTTTLRQDGSFDFENIPSGRYRVHVGRGTRGRHYVKRVRYGSSHLKLSFPSPRMGTCWK